MIKKTLKLAFNQKHLREKFLREMQTNGLKSAIKKTIKKASEGSQPKFEKNKNNTHENNDFYTQLFSQTGTSDKYVPLRENSKPVTNNIKLIAFYLPQFHPIPENDSNWGKGFTEWTNVSKAIPQYIGHHQPKLPGELGFYDLRVIENQQRQIELAKAYGIYGFCYHHYWFDGKRIMDTPIEQLLSHPELNFPFCINWANENWTKKWDGYDSDVILAQNHSAEDDLAFIADTARYMSDPRYIRVEGKPLLMLYRPALLPDAKATANRWRIWCRENGIGEIYLVTTHSFEHIDPHAIGFDAAVEFAPNSFPLRDITDSMKSEIINSDYQGSLYDYNSAIEISDTFKTPSYTKFRGVCPRWDNEARKPGKGTTLVGSTPEKYEKWLSNLCTYTQDNFESSKQFVFINAWNEWAEGAYLEPDRKYGYAYLEATRNALNQKETYKKILYVSHDAHFHGAQILSLNIVRALKEIFHLEVHMVLKSGGKLENEFSQYATVYNLKSEYSGEKEQIALMKKLRDSGVSHAICNTVVSGDIVGMLSDLGFKILALIHELPNLIKQYKMETNSKIIAEKADYVIFPSSFVAERFNSIAQVQTKKSIIRPQGLYQVNQYENDLETARKKLRNKLELDQSSKIVLGAGFADQRKGFDIFVKSAKEIGEQVSNVYFVWVGDIEINMLNKMDALIKDCKNLILIPAQKEISLFYSGADIYLMTSREDPFPSVVMEAMNVKVPVIGFKNAGGFQDIVNQDTGILVPFENEPELHKAVIELINNESKRQKLGEASSILIKNTFLWKDYIYDLLNFIGFNYKKISVIVPNYNYESYILQRLKSIEDQTYPIYELIYLDDCSKDKSLNIAKAFQSNTNLDMKIIENYTNSGSVFNQWFKGMDITSGDYVWIAEADDLCETNFLETAMKGFQTDNTVLSYTQSKQIDENTNLITSDYLDYTCEINSEKWKNNYFNTGINEVQTALAIKNTIPNISGVVFKNIQVPDDFRLNLINYKIAGDWMFYIWLCTKGDVAFNNQSLNAHRRHNQSVTKSENNILHYNEVVGIQEYVITNYTLSEYTSNQIKQYRKFLRNYLQISKD